MRYECTQGCDTLYTFKGRLHILVCTFVENIALNKSAKEEFPYVHPKVSASNAVDGRKTDLSGLGGQCSVSAVNKTTATWWVNLTSILSIHHITIYYRTDNVAWGMFQIDWVFVYYICFKSTIIHS